ncbi:MAG TPA: hypothetical protein VJL29_00145 [Thermoguttaceae bacterium]|nr:hypothetical protein [Thermoguttaceae bacterium]
MKKGIFVVVKSERCFPFVDSESSLAPKDAAITDSPVTPSHRARAAFYRPVQDRSARQ